MPTFLIQHDCRIGPRNQQGAATLFITLMVLLVLGIIVLASSTVGVFEQKTATNEGRQHLAEQAAEYALNMGGEYIKANVAKISTTAAGGWLDATTASNIRWKSCAGITDTTHPCFAERNLSRRNQMYYYSSDGSIVTSGSSIKLNLPYDSLMPTAGKLTAVGGTAAFPATATVRALLCRLETGSVAAAASKCALSPVSGRRIAVTLIAQGNLPGENATSVVKETWGTFNASSFSAATPLVASGFVQFVGTYTIVAAPNAGGYGVAASVWSPNDATGPGSWQTCQRDDYLNGASASQLTSCGTGLTPITCDCNTEVISNKGTEGNDILDVDGGAGALPDISFFPGKTSAGVRMDSATDFTDDNLFEWIFGVDVTGGNGATVLQTCTPIADCEVQALADLGFDSSHPNCDFLDKTSSGLFYVPGAGACSLGKGGGQQVGDPTRCVVLVTDEDVTLGHIDFYGMIFVRSESNAAQVKGNANGHLFGSAVIEGDARLNGTMDLVYNNCSAGNPNDPLPDTTVFGRVPGSWLDNANGI